MKSIPLPQFLTEVDSYTESMTKQQVCTLLHETVRKLDESERESVLLTMRKMMEGTTCTKKEHAQVLLRIDKVYKRLKRINEGYECLNVEIDDDYDDRYDTYYDQFMYEDPHGISRVINEALDLVHTCVMHEMFKEGMKLCEYLITMQIHGEGDVDDTYDIFDMHYREVFFFDRSRFVKECLYLTYMTSPLQERAGALWKMIKCMGYPEITLESIMKTGNMELPESDAFLPSWIALLASESGSYVSGLLLEAFGMLKTMDEMKKTADRYGKFHPELFDIMKNLKE